MKQMTFADAEYAGKRKQTRKELFLIEMDRVVPWKGLIALIEPHYPKGEGGRPAYPLMAMLRVHLLQNWFGYSDPAMEEALYETTILRQFAGLNLVQSPRGQPDPYTVMHQHFHAVGAAVGEQISTVRLRRTEYLHYTGQCGLGAGAHVHRLSGKPDAIDADHGASPRTKRAQPSGSDTGHFTVTDCSPSDSSIITDAAVGRLGVALNGTNAGNAAGS